jgi:iron complex transport system ATP-binding protein
VGHLSVGGLQVQAGGRTLLSGVDLDVSPGEFVAVVGANGVGKTTLLRILAGVAPASAGYVQLDGRMTKDMRADERARALTLLAGEGGEADAMSVREAVAVGRYAHRRWWDWRRSDSDAVAVATALQRVDLVAFAERSLLTLSSGERARVWLALALAQGSQTLLLDEPTSHLDVRFAQEMLRLLREIASTGATVVTVLHDLNEAAAFADRVAILGQGRVLAFDAPRRALTAQMLERAYDVAFEVFETPAGYRIFTC